MNHADEFREIIGRLKNTMVANQEMGFDFPALIPLSHEDLHNGRTRPGSLDDLKSIIGDCERCKLWRGRSKLVFGEGASNAKLVFVGEGPGHEEDLSGRPFVGEAGKLLTRIIENGMGTKREEVYICNVVKCRPPNNRDPERDEIETCIPFLREQIEIIKPEVICVLGRIAGQELLGKDFKITRDRGKWYSYMDIPVMATYHPAYILRNPSRERELKGQVWKDVQKIMARLGLEIKKNG
jgi:uracil-DNA glycosylase family 4